MSHYEVGPCQSIELFLPLLSAFNEICLSISPLLSADVFAQMK